MQPKRTHQRIKDLQSRELPINRSYVLVNADGKLEERKGRLKERVVCGYGLIWGSKNDYGETFVKGCASKSISENGPASDAAYKIKFRDRHGKSCALFAKLKEDNIGLYFETLPLDDVPWANELLTQLESGTINNFSIGFKHCWDRIEFDDENDTMINLEIKLFEISAVDIPSDINTYAVRSAEENGILLSEIESFIITLPKSRQLDGRKIFARCMLPTNGLPPGQERKAQKVITPAKVKAKLDLHYLLKNI